MRPIFILLLVFLGACTITGSIVKEEEPLHAEVYFCPEYDCYREFSKALLNSSAADCALYSIDEQIVKSAIGNNVSLKIVTDSRSKLSYGFVRKMGKKGLMHNKFCILDDETVITGSFNPVKGSHNDYNNVILIKSRQLSKNYKEEFDELWNNEEDKRTENSRILIGNYLVENYFCPEDDCAGRIENLVNGANKSIYFMAYSFTHKGISNSLIIKKSGGLEIRGVIDSSNINVSVYGVLKNNDVEVKSDNSKNLMHNKVFIIDGETVVTGSFNPTKSGNERNDENILIIHNPEVAEKFLQEFWKIYNAG